MSMTSATSPAPGRIATFSGLSALTSLAIFVQSVTAGQFVSQDGRDSWITVHGVVADAAWILALLTAVAGFVFLRRTSPALVGWAVVLFVATLAQTGIGHLITDYHHDGWIGVHVPLAFAILGLTLWLTARAWQLRRRAGGAVPAR